MRILLVNHTGDFSGAEVAMLRLLHTLPPSVTPAVACPPDSRFAAELTAAGIETLPIPSTSLSFRLNPRATSAGLVALARASAAVRRHTDRWRPDVVHANGTRAGLLCAALGPGGPSTVVQIHDILPQGRTADLVRHVLACRADRIVAVSRAASDAFNAGLPSRPARTTYISVDQERFRDNGHDVADVRRSLGVPEGAPLLGVVAQISPWKGQLCAVEALALLRRRRADAHLALVGSVAFTGPYVRYDNAAYARELEERVAALGLEDAVHFAGHRRDVPAIMAALDLFLLPSWNEPFGTVIAEAMATGTVPLVSDAGGPPEFVEDGVSGRLLPACDPERWAQAAEELLDDPDRRARIARQAADVAGRFTDEAYAGAMLEHYAAVAR